MKKLITTAAFLLCCTAAIAQTNPIVVIAPDGRVVQCITSGGITKCY